MPPLRYPRIPNLPFVSRNNVPRQLRSSSSAASSRWKMRQGSDAYAREAKSMGLKSRAAFKLIEMDNKYRLFAKGQTVVDLGFAPGSWSQVAVGRTRPGGCVVGIDLIPAQPPDGVVTVQGDFLSPKVQTTVKRYLVEARAKSNSVAEGDWSHEGEPDLKVVDLVLSDMMMNTSGIPFKDHAGSMDLCQSALQFARDTLKPGGHFVCKFYQGSEDKDLENSLKAMFEKVFREKPESSRKESREAFFVALRRKSS